MRPSTGPTPRLVAYLNDPVAVRGAGGLMRQKRAAERAAAALGAGIDVLYVDSGRRFAGQRCGDAVLRLLADLRRGDTVLVEDMASLAADEEAVAVVAGTMAMLGAAVVAARGLFADPIGIGTPSLRPVPEPGRRSAPAKPELEACL